jgi:hypothetical protein
MSSSHQVIDHALQLPGVRQRVVPGRSILQFEQPLDIGQAERRHFLPQPADVMQAIDADRVTRASARFRGSRPGPITTRRARDVGSDAIGSNGHRRLATVAWRQLPQAVTAILGDRLLRG